MKNKTIAITDLSSYEFQNLETLIFSNILEKKYDACGIFDLNFETNPKQLSEIEKWTKGSKITKTKIFQDSMYHRIISPIDDHDKIINYIESLQKEYSILLINANVSQPNINAKFYNFCDEIVLFVNFNDLDANSILQFFLKQSIKNKNTYLVIYNFDKNIQSTKKYLSLMSSFKSKNTKIHSISSIPNLCSVKEISKIDPWSEIYKFINSTF